MVGQNRSEQVNVSQHRFDRASGQCCERRIRGSEHREGTFPAQGLHQTGCNDGGLKGRVILAVHNDVHNGIGRRARREQHSVDDMHHPIVRRDVRHDDLRVVDEHAVRGDGHVQLFPIERFDGHAVHEVRAQVRTAHHVVGQNSGQQIVVSQHGFERALW